MIIIGTLLPSLPKPNDRLLLSSSNVMMIASFSPESVHVGEFSMADTSCWTNWSAAGTLYWWLVNWLMMNWAIAAGVSIGPSPLLASSAAIQVNSGKVLGS